MIFVASLALVACGSKSAPPPPAVDGLVLLDAGREPKRVARYVLSKQVVVPLELAMDVDLKLGDRGGALPTLVMNLDIGTEDVQPDGNARTRTTIKAATARDRAQTTSVPTEQLARQAASLPGLAVVATVSPAGEIVDARTEMDGKAVPLALQAQISSLQQNLEQLAMPLPTQMIGPGAKWRYRKTIDVNGAQLVTVTTVDVLAFVDKSLEIALATEISGADQQATRDGLTVDIKRIRGSGSGKGTIDLSRMTMTGERTMKVQFDMIAEGRTAPLDMTVAMRVAPPQGAQSAP